MVSYLNVTAPVWSEVTQWIAHAKRGLIPAYRPKQRSRVACASPPSVRSFGKNARIYSVLTIKERAVHIR